MAEEASDPVNWPTGVDAEPTSVGSGPTPVGSKPTPVGSEPTQVGFKPTLIGPEPTPVGFKPTPVGSEPTQVGFKPIPCVRRPLEVTLGLGQPNLHAAVLPLLPTIGKEISVDVPATLTSKGRITLPKSVRDALGLQAGDRIFFRVFEGRAVLVRVEDFLDLAGSVSVAPEKRGTRWPEIKASTWRNRATARGHST